MRRTLSVGGLKIGKPICRQAGEKLKVALREGTTYGAACLLADRGHSCPRRTRDGQERRRPRRRGN